MSQVQHLEQVFAPLDPCRVGRAVNWPDWAFTKTSTASVTLPYTLVAKNAQREYADEILKDRKARLFSLGVGQTEKPPKHQLGCNQQIVLRGFLTLAQGRA